MNSPDPGSPISSDSSGSPPPEDFQFSNRDHQQMLNTANEQLLSKITSSFAPGSSSSKRRLPGGSTFEGSSRRDLKSRRREDAMGMAGGSRRILIEGQSSQFSGTSFGPTGSASFQSRGDYGPRRDKEELVDLSLVEQLRQGQSQWPSYPLLICSRDVLMLFCWVDFGDPFMNSGLKQLS
ncbi:hypothetical protein HYDPIDRAFT_114248, partial [Hydnomerulius pinastri MD-312]